MNLVEFENTTISVNEYKAIPVGTLMKDVTQGTYNTGEGYCSTYLIEKHGKDVVVKSLWLEEGENGEELTNEHARDAFCAELEITEEIVAQLNAFKKANDYDLITVDTITIEDFMLYIYDFNYVIEEGGEDADQTQYGQYYYK